MAMRSKPSLKARNLFIRVVHSQLSRTRLKVSKVGTGCSLVLYVAGIDMTFSPLFWGEGGGEGVLGAYTI